MKLPKEVKRYCPHCKKHTAQALSTQKQRSRSSTHPLSRGGQSRVQARGFRVGFGNQGRYSKKGVKDYKMKTKITKRIPILYKCKVCSKIKGIKKAIRSSRIEIGDKISR